MTICIAAIKCAQALDMPFAQGKTILESYGWNYANRFNYPATQFVKDLQKKALSN